MEVEENPLDISQCTYKESQLELLQIDKKCLFENDSPANEKKHMLDKGNQLFADGELELALVHFYRGKRLQCSPDIFQPYIDNTIDAINTSIKGNFEKEFRAIEELLVNGGKLKDDLIMSEKEKLSSKTEQVVTDPSLTDITFISNVATRSKCLIPLSGQEQFVETIKNMHDYLQKNRTAGAGKAKEKAVRRLETQQRREEREKKADSERLTVERILADIEELWRHCQMPEVANVGKEGLSFLSQAQLPSKEKYDFKAKLLNHIVQANLENGNYKESVQYLDELEELAKVNESDELEIASQTMRGQVLALSGDFAGAAKVWTQVSSRIFDDFTKAWLYHELGRCYYELGKIVDAEEYGRLSLKAAKAAGSDLWTAHALILSAQVEALLGCYQAALGLMQKAAHYASCLPQQVVSYLQQEQIKLQEVINRTVTPQDTVGRIASKELLSNLVNTQGN